MGRTAQFAICADPNTPNRTGGATTTNASLSCPSGTPQYIIGSGGPSQSNVLQVRTWGGSISAKLRAGDHNFRLLGEWNHTKTFNLFVNPSAGSYYFDSIADFRNGNAQSFSYNNAGTLNPNDAAANFSYDTYTFGLQDDWRVNKMLSVTAGLRYDVYGTSSHPQLNPNFLTRYGFPNTYSIEGMGLLQPRVGFTSPTPRLTVRGGGGIFGGGSPDVYIGNSFSNTGVINTSITARVTDGGVYQQRHRCRCQCGNRFADPERAVVHGDPHRGECGGSGCGWLAYVERQCHDHDQRDRSQPEDAQPVACDAVGGLHRRSRPARRWLALRGRPALLEGPQPGDHRRPAFEGAYRFADARWPPALPERPRRSELR
jgi:hypothetical protein